MLKILRRTNRPQPQLPLRYFEASTAAVAFTLLETLRRVERSDKKHRNDIQHSEMNKTGIDAESLHTMWMEPIY